MSVKSKKQLKEPSKTRIPCGNIYQEFISKICLGEDTGCGIYWRFSQGLIEQKSMRCKIFFDVSSFRE